MKKENLQSLDDRQTYMLEQLKKISFTGLEDLQIDHLLFNTTWLSIQMKTFSVIRVVVKRLFANSFYINNGNISGKDLLLISYDYKRKDHTISWNTVKSMFDDYDELKIGELSFSAKSVLPVAEILDSVSLWKEYVSKMKNVGTIIERCVLAAYLVELKRMQDLLNKIEFNNKVGLLYFDGGSYENLIVQCLKRRNVTMITMQHGQPVFHGVNVDRINQNMILNLTSDYIIVTGEFSKKQFEKAGIPNDKVVVLGSWREIEPYSESTSNIFSVFFDCPTLEGAFESNCQMIKMAEEIANKFAETYYIKLHPQDNSDRYSKVRIKKGKIVSTNNTLQDIINKSKYCILHASGVYLDIIAKGKKVYCLQNEIDFPLVENEMDLFTSEDELCDKIINWNNRSLDNQKEYMKDLVGNYLSPDNCFNRHRKFIKQKIAEKNEM